MLARSFQSSVSSRNFFEYAACAAIIIAFGYLAARASSWIVQVGYALGIAAALFISWQLHARASVRSLPPTGALSALAFHRAELARQRDALRSVWGWYLAPMIPSFVVVALGRLLETPSDWPFEIASLAVVGILLVGVLHLNLQGAEALQRDIEEIDALSNEGSGASEASSAP
jgi:signal transduction histidine kinase